jgi:hypothetical protein
MNAEKFNKDFEFYKNNLLKVHDGKITNLMLHAYCMGYCELSNHLNEEFDSNIIVDPVLDKILELNEKLYEK